MTTTLGAFFVEHSGRYTEAQLVVLVLAMLVVAVALLSYFVVAPEYEKRLEKQFAATYAVPSSSSSTTSTSISQNKRSAAQRYLALTQKKLTKHRSLGRWDMEAASSDDDAYVQHVQRLLTASERDDAGCSSDYYSDSQYASHYAITTSTAGDSPPRSVDAAAQETLTDAQRHAIAQRRKSESDALKHANVNRAEMVRRRVLLKKLEEEIQSAMKEHNASATATASSACCRQDAAATASRDAAAYNKLQQLQQHPAECVQELAVLAARDTNASALPQALETLRDVLALYLSTDHRDMHKLTVFCNSLLRHDGLNHLRALEVAMDANVRTLATSIIEMAVPAIWH